MPGRLTIGVLAALLFGCEPPYASPAAVDLERIETFWEAAADGTIRANGRIELSFRLSSEQTEIRLFAMNLEDTYAPIEHPISATSEPPTPIVVSGDASNVLVLHWVAALSTPVHLCSSTLSTKLYDTEADAFCGTGGWSIASHPVTPPCP